jgi:L-rhamnonate dehydratase
MKITDVRAIYPRYRQPLRAWRSRLWQIVVRIETDAGVTGYGYGGGGEAALPIINGHFRELLLDRTVESAADIATIWDDLYAASIPYGRKGVAIMALSGVDLALWDLLGRAERVPVYQLLGGRRKERVRAYATGPDSAWYAELGYTAHKLSHQWKSPADSDRAVAMAARARSLFGPDAPLMFDCYMSWDAQTTREMAARLAEFNIVWFEDVTTPEQLAEQAALREEIRPIKLAGGEHEFTHYGFAELARSQALDIWQPDITWCGGITAGLRILDVARRARVPVIPHRGGEVWGLHFILATDCENWAERNPGRRHESHDHLWLDQPEADAGYLTATDAPGFGVRVNEELL